MQESQEKYSPIPPVLLRSPRNVRRKPGTLAMLLVGRIFTAPFVAAAAVLLAFVVLEPIVVFLLPAQPARIIGQWRDLKAHGGVAYYVEYQLDQSGFIGRDEVLFGEFNALQVGMAVKAHAVHLGQLGYSALDRSLRSYARYRMIVWFGAVFSVAIGAVLFYPIWLTPWRSHRLARNGQATVGAVVSKSIFHTGRRHVYFTLTYQFKALGILRARRIFVSSGRYESAGLGDLIIILFDPARPNRNIVYDYCDFIAT